MLKLTRLLYFLAIFCCALLSSGQNPINPTDTLHRFFKQLPLYIDSFLYDGTQAYLGQMGMDTAIAEIYYYPIDSFSANRDVNAAILPDTSSQNLEYQDDSFFVIKVDGKFRKYNKEYNHNYGSRNDFSWIEYKGYFPDLGWYVLHRVAIGEGLYLGSGEMVRKSDARNYEIIGYSDAGTSGIILAPNKKALLILDNTDYNNVCTIVLIGIDSVRGLIDFKTLAIQHFNRSVNSVIWPEKGNPILQLDPTHSGDGRREVSSTEYIELNITDLLPK